ncbi:YAF9 [Sanghuangporus sanghuang]|uniref:Protein AF-9 homolog n=1 Tax=Sanghuangporus baumii TaxID=108892 RepID=A0A9Q5HWZ8_SANBA|nr:yeats-domain-containing protein [Sanghuangporus baumii]
MSNDRVRVRGLSIYRPIIYGNTAVVLSPEERAALPSAQADHTHRWTVAVRSAASAPGSNTVGGADDISYFIKRVTFKLHETYPNPTRVVDKPPFEVTETGWGEFEIQIRINFVAEAGEKQYLLYHHLKLHPWTAVGSGEPEIPPPDVAAKSGPVHSWQYDEVVFNDPFQSFLNILMAHPPTPLPKVKTRPVPFNIAHPESIKDAKSGGTPEFTQAMITEEAERLEKARKDVIAEQDKWRGILIEKERELERLRKQLEG